MTAFDIIFYQPEIKRESDKRGFPFLYVQTVSKMYLTPAESIILKMACIKKRFAC
jgi:hypothetical protein